MVKRDRAEARTNELTHRVSDGLHHAAHQSVTTLMHNNLNGRDVAVGIDDAEGINLDRTVLQLNSVHQGTLDARLHLAVQTRHVGLSNLIGRVSQAIRQLTIVGQQKEAGGVDVKATDVVQTG